MQPHFEEVSDKEVKGCLLLCPLEGCTQSAFLYQKAVRIQMASQGCTQSMTEPNIYILVSDGSTLRIAVYVDNMLIANEPTASGRDLKNGFIQRFAQRFNIEVMGTPTRFLGMEIERTDDTLTLKQTSYITNGRPRRSSSQAAAPTPSLRPSRRTS